MQPTEDWLPRPGSLAERLKNLRQAAGLTGRELARRLGTGQPKISKIESGKQNPSEDDVRRWAEATGHPEQIDSLLTYHVESQVHYQRWKDRFRARGQAGIQQDRDQFVRRGSRIRDFEIMIIPGLLQTPDYIRHMARQISRLHGTDPEKIEDVVAARMRRQEVLYDTSKSFEFVITQAALDYPPCPAEVMAGQIDRLASLAGMGHITLGIIPAGIILAATPMIGFLIVDDTTVLETLTSSITLTGDESARYAEIFGVLRGQAVTGEEARRMLTAAAARLTR
jgi:transcriptional regulator with XRE-family HTH domain